MTVEPVPAETEAEQTTLIRRVDAPLPPYAQPTAAAAPPMPANAPTPPAPSTPAPTVADAMRQISMPPLAATTTELVAAEPTAAEPGPTVISGVTSGVVVMPPPATETVTCPECGTIAQVTLNRRDSVDFCRTCDFPLFWTPSKVVRDASDTTDQSLRRLPGQAGRATVASMPCPFCYEPNALSAETCIRCGKPMHPVEAPPPPQPVYIAPPPAPVVEPPKQKVAWWVWALLAAGGAALIVLIVLIATGVIG
jgi:hypothetical protein